MSLKIKIFLSAHRKFAEYNTTQPMTLLCIIIFIFNEIPGYIIFSIMNQLIKQLLEAVQNLIFFVILLCVGKCPALGLLCHYVVILIISYQFATTQKAHAAQRILRTTVTLLPSNIKQQTVHIKLEFFCHKNRKLKIHVTQRMRTFLLAHK